MKLEDRIKNLPPEKRALLEKKLKEKLGKRNTLITASRDGNRVTFPLSFAQQRLWFLYQLDPDSPFYNIPASLRLSGSLDIPSLKLSINDVVKRHEALRTVFRTEGKETVQKIYSELSINLPIEDISKLKDEEQEVAIKRLSTEEARKAFDLGKLPLIHCKLLSLSDTENILIINMHHIVSDGWSISVFNRELKMFYAHHTRGAPVELEALPIQYCDFSVWQREWMSGEILDEQLSYWKKTLEDAPQLLEMPLDRSYPPVKSYEGRRVRCVLSQPLMESLKQQAMQNNATLFMFLIATFNLLLSKYSHQQDIVVGSPIAGRQQQETEGLIGFFVNTLALRTDLSGDPSFRELLSRVREATLGAYTYQDLPFERIVEELKPERSLSYSPLFQVMFALQSASTGTLQLEGLDIQSGDIDSGVEKFDLTISATESTEGLHFLWSYNTDVYNHATIERMTRHFQTLLEQIVVQPDKPVSEYELLTAGEHRQLLVDWNATEAIYPKDQCIQQLFEAQVLRTPKAAAVVYQDQQLSYAELNAWANRLAHYLIDQGVGPDTLVALCLERSPALIVAVLGIIKAGGAYVPLDPEYPKERMAFMLEDTRAPVLITQSSLRKHLFEQSKASVLALDADAAVLERYSEQNPSTRNESQHLAYVIFTSGSTGRPKGVEISHRSLANLVTWHQQTFSLSPQDRTTLIAGPAFDASVFEIWPSLTAGTSLYIPDEAVRMSPGQLINWYAEKGVTVSFLPTPLAVAFLGQNRPAGLALRVLQTGGEALQLSSLEVLPFQLINLYGPTENTVATTAATVLPDQSGHSPPIGHPISNTQVYILDARLKPVPIGVVGELYIGGDGLARGYLNRPKLTAERFILNPLAGTPGERLYKTGDLVRYLADGNIEYIGRSDDQVKIRGFRIELGEIEATLSQHPQVKDSLVMVREEETGDKRLVAYVVSKQAAEDVTASIRDYLKQTLPEYMVPSAFVVLDAFPLTPNGKVDKQALSALKLTLTTQTVYVPPRTPVEEELVTIWCELLQQDRVGIHDNFFHLGGHSLLATQVMSRIQSVFQVGLPLRSLFENPTIAEMSLVISSAQTDRSSAVEQHIIPVKDRNSAELSFAQQRLWFLYSLDPDSPFYNISAAWRLKGMLDAEVLKRALNIIIQRHEALRTTFSMQQGEPVQLIAPSLTLPLPVIDLCDLTDAEREAEVQRLVTKEARQSFDPEKGPLLCVKLLHLKKQEYVFLLIIHHIISDGWSMGVLMRELMALYNALVEGQPDPLPALPIQYADFAVWQRDWLQGEVLDKQQQYWKERLTGVSTLELPTDRPRPAVQTLVGDYLPFELSEPLTEALKVLANDEGATLFMTLLATFQLLLHRYTHQQDIVVGSPIAGRQQQETEGLIGFFVNTLALRADLSDDPTFRELLAQVRATTLGAYAYQDLPFEKLVEELQPERNLSHSPVFQVMFALQNIPSRDLKLADLAISRIVARSHTAKYELSLFMVEEGKKLSGLFEYNSDLFDEATIQRMAEHFQMLLEEVVSRPDQHVSALTILTGVERQQLLFDWNATVTDYPQDQCIQQLFEAQVARTPEAVALVYQQQQLCYADLNARANRLAHYLIEQGVGADTLVALCLERSLDLIVAVVGILKAGGAYVPLDPSYPQERLAFMLEDSRAPVLITQSSLQAALPPHEAAVLCLDAATDSLANYADTNPAVRTQPHHLAYINYTSGSTGKPKGVMIPHQGVTRLIFGANYVTLDAHKTLLHMAPISFDAATFELWGALLHGGRCVLYPERVPTPEGLKVIIAEQGVDTLFITTALFNAVMDLVPEAFKPIKQLLTGGEAHSVDHIKKARALLTETRLSNIYGPTESTTFTTYNPLSQPISDSLSSIPIGRPISNTQVYILDTHLKPVPIGVVGELYIGGDGLARGYLNRPELTAECFIPNPLPGTPGEHLYKSGDRVRYLADGNIEFMGRSDDQIKIRGFRIELGEIESTLSQHPQVQDSLVIVREEGAGDKRLVAYVVTDQVAENVTASIRDSLKEMLPAYMVPSAFVTLDAFPLTPNGKVDKKALSTMDMLQSPETACVAPRNITEQTLASIWCKLLGRETVSVLDNFFELGGHSLLAVRLLNNIEKTFSRKLPLAALFQAPTIDGLARILRKDDPEFTWSRLMPIQPSGSRPPLFFISGSTFKQIISRYLGDDQPFFGFEDFGVDGERATYITVEDLASFYIKELRAFKPNGPYMLAGFCFGGLVAFEMARELINQGEQVLLLVLIDSVNPDSANPETDTHTVQHEGRISRFKNITRRENPIFVTKLLLRKIKNRIVSYGDKIVLQKDNFLIRSKKFICNIYLFLNVPIPVSLRDFYIVENYVVANSLFHPQAYEGNITLLRSETLGEYDEQLGWGEIAKGGVKVHFLKGKHISLIDDEENAALLAKAMNIEIEQALNKAGL